MNPHAPPPPPPSNATAHKDHSNSIICDAMYWHILFDIGHTTIQHFLCDIVVMNIMVMKLNPSLYFTGKGILA